MNELNVLTESNVQAFDEYTLNPNHRLEYSEDGAELTAVWPSNADTDTYVVAVVTVEDNSVSLPEGSAVLEADSDAFVTLIPKDAYGGE